MIEGALLVIGVSVVNMAMSLYRIARALERSGGDR